MKRPLRWMRLNEGRYFSIGPLMHSVLGQLHDIWYPPQPAPLTEIAPGVYMWPSQVL